MSFYRQNGDIKIKKQRQINDGIIKIVIMGWLIVIGTFFGKILLKIRFRPINMSFSENGLARKNYRKDVLKKRENSYYDCRIRKKI